MKGLLSTVAAVLLLLGAVPAIAAEDPVKHAVEGALGTFVQRCEKELTTFCKDVTPGDGRILACLYAYQDKLSPRCEYALYDSAAQFDRLSTLLPTPSTNVATTSRAIALTSSPARGACATVSTRMRRRSVTAARLR